MNEQTWNESRFPRKMIDLLSAVPYRGNQRKQRRLACCALTRLRWVHLIPAAQEAVQLAEKLAFGLVKEPKEAVSECRKQCLDSNPEHTILTWTAMCCLTPAIEWEHLLWVHHDVTHGFTSGNLLSRDVPPPNLMDRPAADILRDLWDYPYRRKPIFLNPDWITEDVRSLCLAVWACPTAIRMNILADALEEAGCNSPLILGHLRNDRCHVRGCWVLELIRENVQSTTDL